MKRRNVAILLFDDVEVLDLAGPFEVFSVTDRINDRTLFNVFTVAENARAITARNGLSVNPNCALPDCPKLDILIVPGGYGTRALLNNEHVIQWIQWVSEEVELVLSVCSGALVLAGAGLLEGLRATTHHLVFDDLASLAPNTEILRDQRYVDNGSIITSAGVSAGIDTSLYVVERLLGRECAVKTAAYIEYERAGERGTE